MYASFLDLFRLRAKNQMTMFVCYKYTDNFLHLETHESQTCLTLAKTSFNGGIQPDSCTKI